MDCGVSFSNQDLTLRRKSVSILENFQRTLNILRLNLVFTDTRREEEAMQAPEEEFFPSCMPPDMSPTHEEVMQQVKEKFVREKYEMKFGSTSPRYSRASVVVKWERGLQILLLT